MNKLDPAVKRETLRIAAGTLVLSVIMEAVFLILKKWDPTVLFGNLLGAFAAVLNFFLMSLTLVKCFGLEKDKVALRIRTSQMGRLFMQAAFAGVGAMLPCFNTVAVLVPLLFPSIVIVFIRLTENRKNGKKSGEDTEPAATEQTGPEAADSLPEQRIEDRNRRPESKTGIEDRN